MDRIRHFALFILATVFMLTSCSSGDAPKYHPNIQAYTSGTISRYSAVSISFTEDLPAEKQTQEFLSKNIKLSPAADVNYAVTDNYIVTIQPKDGLKRDTEYTVKINMSKFIDGLDSNLSSFEFKVKTLPLLCHGSFGALEINSDDDSKYDVPFTLVTADSENASDAESLVTFSERVDAQWSHDATGRIHTALLSGIEAGSAERQLKFSLKSSGDYPSEGVRVIPDKNTFRVYDVTVKGGSERCVYIYFTKLLDMEQDIKGLAYIDGNTNERVQIERNCLKLYYDEKLSGQVNIFVNKGIKSSKGLTLTESTAFQRTLGGDAKPYIQFVSQGAILPLSSNLTVQLKSLYMRGVVVRVIEVPQRNMAQFIQAANLDDNSEMRRVGRLVNQEVIFLDEDPTIDLTEPHIFSINLNNLFNANPGSLYRIELSGYSKLSLYPCSENLTASKEDVKAYFDQKFAEERLSMDGDGYYYYFSNGDGYSWWDNDEPCKASFYDDVKDAKNVMATNIGLVAKCGSDGKINIWTNNLTSAKVEGGVSLKVYNFQHYLIAEGVTNSDGFASLQYTNGRPYYVVAVKDGDTSYLRIDDGNSLSLSSFETSGKVLQAGLGGFIYGDRGVWRPGDTLHIGFMLGDRSEALPKEHPVTFELTNPLGQKVARRVQSNGTLGLYAFNIPVAADAPTGMYTAEVSVGGAKFTKYLRIETVMPNRLKVQPDFGSTVLQKGKPISGTLHTEWLNGAQARNLKYDMQATFTGANTTFSAYKGYVFTNMNSRFQSEESKLYTGVTNENGNATLNFTLDGGGSAPGMLNATITTKVYEPSGQFSIDVTRKKYSPYRSYVGIKSPQNGREALDTDKAAQFSFATVDANGNPLGGKRINLKIYKVDWYWWWSSDDSYLAEYSSNSYNKPVVNQTYVTDGSGSLTYNFTCKKADWGVYLVYARDVESGHSAALLTYFDYPGNPTQYGGGDAATMLSFKPDKETYTVGEKVKITIPSVAGAKALVTVENSTRVLSAQTYSCSGTSTQVEIPVTADMRPNAYIHISLVQPYAETANDMPIRLYGVAGITVNDPDSHLNPVITAKDEILPNEEFTIKVKEQNGKDMAYTIAIVDEGLLDLTHFKTPDPWNAFNAHEALGVRTWDLYNLVIGAYGGKIEQMFSIGGDEDSEGEGAKALINRFTPVVKFAGPFYLKKGGSETHKFYMPNYNGKVRTMVVAGNGNAYGSAEKSILVRQPVMVLGTLPRIVGQGEQITVPATVFATKDNIGSVKVTISCSKEFSVQGASETTLNFSKIGDMPASFTLLAGNATGKGTVTIKAQSGNSESVYKTELEIRSVADEITKYQDITIPAGKEWKGKIDAFGMDGTNSLSVEVSGVRPINLSSRMDYLTGYPHGCVEQLVSKAFPMVFLADLTSLDDEQKSACTEAVTYALGKLSSYQVFDGSLSYWPGSSYTNTWGTIYAAHFITEAEKAGYNVPYSLKQNIFKYLKNSAKGWKLQEGALPWVKSNEISTQAYRLYVLGLSGNSDLGSLNRLKEEANTSLSKWLVAGAYAVAGRKDMCEKFISATDELTPDYSGANPTFGSDIRDNALRLQVLCILGKQTEATAMYNQIAANLASERWYSTQDIATSLASIAQYQKKYGKPEPAKGSITYGSNTSKFNTTVGHIQTLASKSGKFDEIVIKNTGEQQLFVHFVNTGTVKGTDTEAMSNGIGVAVSYTDAEMHPIDVKNLSQGTNFIATITVRNNTATDVTNLALTQIVPSGWEILNTKFASEEQDVYSGSISYQDVRDDRVLTYIDYLPSGKQTTISIKLTASYIGTYALPSIKCEAMYNAQISARTSAGICKVVE